MTFQFNDRVVVDGRQGRFIEYTPNGSARVFLNERDDLLVNPRNVTRPGLSRKAMQGLKAGQRLVFSDGVKGTVTSVSVHAIGVDWEDGQSGYISVEDGQQITLTSDDDN